MQIHHLKFGTYNAVRMPTAHMSTDWCEALSAANFQIFQSTPHMLHLHIGIYIIECAETESDVGIVLWTRFPVRRHTCTISGCMQYPIFPKFAKHVLAEIPQISSIIF